MPKKLGASFNGEAENRSIVKATKIFLKSLYSFYNSSSYQISTPQISSADDEDIFLIFPQNHGSTKWLLSVFFFKRSIFSSIKYFYYLRTKLII